MDRTHRLGQKKVVNVYRLIAHNTVESEVLNVQNFKTQIADAVVNQSNSGLDTMQTSSVFDLLTEKLRKPSMAQTRTDAVIDVNAMTASHEYRAISAADFVKNFPDTG